MWSVDVVEEGGWFVVRTKDGDNIHEMPFSIEGFAHLYARGQRVHFQTLSELAADKPDGTLQATEIAALIDSSGIASQTAEPINTKAEKALREADSQAYP